MELSYISLLAQILIQPTHLSRGVIVRDLIKALKATADESRFRILRILRLRPLCVCEIADVLDLAQSTVSRHLKILEESALLERSKDGLWVEYRLAAPRKDAYQGKILSLLQDPAMDGDAVLREDIRRARSVDRHVLCARD